jgi:hypothetical protein
VEFIDPCLTSIYQPPDIVVNGPLKKMIREEYHNHVFELFRNSEESLSLNAGDKIPVSREDIVGFIENAYDKFLQTEKIVGLQILSKHVVWIHGQTLQKFYLRRILKRFHNLEYTKHCCRSAYSCRTQYLNELKTHFAFVIRNLDKNT